MDGAPSERSALRRWGWRGARVIALGVVVLLAALGARSVWRASDELRNAMLVPAPAPADAGAVVFGDDDFLTLNRSAASQARGVWGFDTASGYVRLGPVADVDRAVVSRVAEVLDGTVGRGDRGTIDSYAYPFDPEVAHDYPVEDVIVPSAVGDLPAWLFPGVRDTWMIFVHGRGVEERHQVHRVLPAFADAGYPVLAITYRNDTVAPDGADGLYRWGLDEWRDLEAAVAFARSNGADDVILVGYGMGGTIVGQFLAESAEATRVAAAVLDSPVVDPGEVAAQLVRDEGMPQFLAGTVTALASLRFDVHWARLDMVDAAPGFEMPILLYHGTADTTSPVGRSDELASAAPAVTYERVEGGRHQQLWNLDPVRYQAVLEGFLADLAAGT